MILPEDEEFLAHYGRKGMRWGVRKDRTPGVSKRTDRKAKQDAEQYVNAKAIAIKSKKKGMTTYGPSVKRYDIGPPPIKMRNVKVSTKKGVDPKAKYGPKAAKKNLKSVTKTVNKKRRKDVLYNKAFDNQVRIAASEFTKTSAGKRMMKTKMSSVYRRNSKKAEQRLVDQLLEGIV